MNMPALKVATIQSQELNFTSTHVLAMADEKWHSAFDIFENQSAVFQMLDARFPLQQRSHKEVKQYLVYYRHIMAFFDDGSHCGFEHPRQFVAFNGSKESPCSILLQEDNLHVELIFNRDTRREIQTLAGISDVQIEFPCTREFTTPDGNDYKV
ncbi:malate synthase [Glaciecola petra]|uniref:Malate synthase n=1 Tax=Glaciecola petra TaxID=3075602 RepID=A0ABU2ZSL1_9ALTE|nr:malate synthase [Aestuariibacter sp. P117]MDT0595620.1 malate synthase [Aestuariibacter sp. P117]